MGRPEYFRGGFSHVASDKFHGSITIAFLVILSFIFTPLLLIDRAPDTNIATLVLISFLLSLISIYYKNSVLLFFNTINFFLIIYPFYLQNILGFSFVHFGAPDLCSEAFLAYCAFIVLSNFLALSHRPYKHLKALSHSKLIKKITPSCVKIALLIFFIFISIYVLYGYSEIFLPRDRYRVYDVDRLSAISKFLLGILKTIPFWLIYFYIIRKHERPGMRIIISLIPAIILSFMISNPINTQRFLSLFGVLIIFFSFLRRGRLLYVWHNSYLIGAIALILLPATSIMRIGQFAFDPSYLANSLFSLEFSALSMLNDFFLTSFHSDSGPVRLISALLIFIPRAIWPWKNEGTGSEIADHAGYVFTNVGVPPIVDGYLDFGILGVLLITIGTGIALRMSSSIFSFDNTNKDISIGIYLSFIGLIPIFLRGDLSTFFIAFYSSISAYFTALILIRLTLKPKKYRYD